jgi:hypothetical protein
MAQRLQRGLDDGTGSGRSTMTQAPGKFWQPDSVSESLRGLGFAKAQQFIYRGTIVATDISDVIGVVATENHSSVGPLPSSDRC